VAQKKKSPNKDNAAAKKTAESPKVTRIKATETRTKTTDKKQSSKTEEKKNTTTKQPTERKNVLRAFGGYFKGAWQELRQVHWPNRRTTWGLTLAVILFTAFFVVLIVVLDYAFQWLFDKVLLG
jgi:preprotein translocase subunit SecE